MVTLFTSLLHVPPTVFLSLQVRLTPLPALPSVLPHPKAQRPSSCPALLFSGWRISASIRLVETQLESVRLRASCLPAFIAFGVCLCCRCQQQTSVAQAPKPWSHAIRNPCTFPQRCQPYTLSSQSTTSLMEKTIPVRLVCFIGL